MAANIAMTIMPAAMAVLLPHISLAAAFWVAGAPALLAGLTTIAIRVSPAQAVPSAASSPWIPPAVLWLPMLASACFGVGFGAFLQFLPLLSTARGDVGAGWLYTCYGCGIMATRWLSRRWLDRARTERVLTIATLLFSAGLAGLAVASTTATLVLGTLLIAVGGGVLHPALIALHARRCPAEPGRATAAFYLGFDAGIGGGSWLLGLALARAGFGGLYALAAAVVLGILATVPALTRRPPA